ncbi:ABC transporter permease subunit [Macrococcus sp. DPC7161]|uniref:ABC transporter permease subunit n=1 Tax=Macrococcus sp. DPC7161 TaxID=2507060 RepID=UPI00100BBD8E|nr:ABC transporter permease subunit [Macrococcus sp. DPC7161]RXK18619.1 ABC transporter permease [Macrococcus sp. DPC7161]
MNITRIMAIAEKDVKEFMRNMALLTMPILPILLGVFYGKLGDKEPMPDKIATAMVVLILAVTFSSVCTSGMMTMLAEENEKGTLRGLINSPASMIDILLGKSIVVIFFTIISIIGSMWMMHPNVSINYRWIVGGVLFMLFFLLIGTALGLHVKTVASTSVYLLPILFIFAMSPMMDTFGLDKDNKFLKLAHYLPGNQYVEYINEKQMSHLFILIIWVVIAFILTVYYFNKSKQDY